VSLIKRSLSAVGKIGIIILIGVAFLFGLTSTVYLSLRSSEVKVPDVVGKDRLTAENALADSGLNIRVRATRPSADAKPDTILMQVPHAGEKVKAGQTVAVDVSRVPKQGEASVSIASAENKSTENKPDEKKEADNANSNQPATKNDNQNANQNQNKPKKNKNTNTNSNNKNANNSNNSNNSNSRNANNRNANQNVTNRNTSTVNRNANTTNVNRTNNNANSNRRAPVTTPSPSALPGNRRTP
jgi:beta-lactam-binding protein with PASTA domain